MVAKKKINLLWIVWFIMWPVILWASYTFYFINIEDQSIDILIFAIFMCVVAFFPLTINNTQIYFINGISIVVFLSYGLFVEILLTQMTIAIVLLNIGLRKKELFRFPLNMLSFIVVSLVGAEVYLLLGGTHGAVSYHNAGEIFAIFGYALTIFIVNQILNKLIDVFFYRREIKIVDKGVTWEFTSLLLILPVGFVLFVLYSEIGRAGIFYLGIPFVFISIILKLLYSYQEVNRYLERTGKIGHKLTKHLNVNEVYDVFIKEITNLLPIDFAYIYSVVDDERLELERFYTGGKDKEVPLEKLERNESLSGKVWGTGKPIIYNKTKERPTYKVSKIPPQTESVLSLPIEYGDSIVGVVTIASKQKKVFDKTHYQILDIVTTYLGIAVENAKHHEVTKAKSEIDGLTQLYNYNYFEKELSRQADMVDTLNFNTFFSLLLLDLDHFKKVNDVYGHEAGNEILYQVANRLREEIGELGILARYGGEEFAILLPQKNLSEAIEIAENIRLVIADNPFYVSQHILSQGGDQEVPITTSIGVATYPDHCETLKELIRHADRAMYIGAKGQGRNKVAIYEDL